MIATALIFVNLAVAVLLVAVNIRCYKSACSPIQWINLAYAAVGVYWIVAYLILLSDLSNPAAIQMLIRPGVTVTLAVMVSSSIIKLRVSK